MRKQRNTVSLRSMSRRGPWAWLLAQGAYRPEIITKLNFRRVVLWKEQLAYTMEIFDY